MHRCALLAGAVAASALVSDSLTGARPSTAMIASGHGRKGLDHGQPGPGCSGGGNGSIMKPRTCRLVETRPSGRRWSGT